MAAQPKAGTDSVGEFRRPENGLDRACRNGGSLIVRAFGSQVLVPRSPHHPIALQRVEDDLLPSAIQIEGRAGAGDRTGHADHEPNASLPADLMGVIYPSTARGSVMLLAEA
jgi:hypothetical protein